MHKDDHVDKNAEDCDVCQALKKLNDCVVTIEADAPQNQTNAPLEVSITVVRDEQKNPISILIVRRDLTQQREVENQLREYRDQLEKMVEDRTHALQLTHQQLLHAEKLSAIGKLSASIAHEFNNPLQGMMYILQGIIKRAWKGRKRIKTQIEPDGSKTAIFKGYDSKSKQWVKMWQHADGQTLAGRLIGQ